jgi:predicted DNA-binding transcriptional regulator YafY
MLGGLLDDILRLGPDVEVLAPQDLRRKVHQHLLAALGRYVHAASAGIFP